MALRAVSGSVCNPQYMDRSEALSKQQLVLKENDLP